MPEENPNDDVRRQMLSYFYERNASARGRRGKQGSATTISVIKRELKEQFSLSQAHVMSNLTYLIGNGWIEEVEEQRTFTTRAGTRQPSTTTYYSITPAGIDLIEGRSSAFRAETLFDRVNITAIASTVTLGDGNVVRSEHQTLRGALDELGVELTEAAELTDDQRLDAVADIESLKSQLAKGQPDRSVVATLWSAVEKVAVVAGLGSSITRIAGQLGPLLG